MASVAYSVRRRLGILKSPHVPMLQRVRCAFSRYAVASPLGERFIKTEFNALSAVVDGFSFKFPCGETSEAKALSFEAFGQLLAEGFIDSTLFRGQVQAGGGDTVLDVGANVGTVTAILSRCVGPTGKVISIEPVMAQTLRENIASNRLSNVQVVECAVGDKNDTVEMSIAPAGIDSSIVHHPGHHHETKFVKVRLLDDVVNELALPHVNFIKLDVEGYEENVINGAKKIIERDRPAWSISAYHRDSSNQPQYPMLVRQLKSLGYRIASVPFFHIYAW